MLTLISSKMSEKDADYFGKIFRNVDKNMDG